jgi:UDP-glucose:(heptosyl)LPS alpha-1,3-glucosyltransferase
VKIALIRRRYTGSGGAERYVAQLAGALATAGHEVHLYAQRWTDPPPRVALHRVPAVPGPGFLRILSFAWVASRMAQRDRFDLIHSFDRVFRADIYRAGDGCHRAWLERRRAVEGHLLRWLDGVNPLHRSLLLLERRLLRPGGCRRVLANSHMVREEILRYYETPPGAVQVIYTGVDLRRFRPPRAPEERAALRRGLPAGPRDPVLLFAGSGFERKGLRFLLQSLGGLRDIASLRLWVLGKGNLESARRQADRLGVSERVHFAGAVADPERWMAAADVFVLPTIYDPFSNACLEAMACGLPLITTSANGAAEIVEEGSSGSILEDPRDVKSLGDRIREFLRPESREERAAAARTCAERFSVEGHVKDVLALYEEALGGQPG